MHIACVKLGSVDILRNYILVTKIIMFVFFSIKKYISTKWLVHIAYFFDKYKHYVYVAR